MIKDEISFTINEQGSEFVELLKNIEKYLSQGLNVDIKISVDGSYHDTDIQQSVLTLLANGYRGLRNNHIENIRITEVSDDYLENLTMWVNRNSRPSERI